MAAYETDPACAQPLEGVSNASTLVLLSLGEGLKRIESLRVPCPDFETPTLLRRFKDSNIFALGGRQSVLFFHLQGEFTGKPSLGFFFFVREIHSADISDFALVGQSVLVCCSKDRYMTEIKLNPYLALSNLDPLCDKTSSRRRAAVTDRP